MYVITVIPISRGIGKENLSYFTASKVELGSLVMVPLRKKNIDALVVEIKDARAMKSEIRNATFALRKVDKLVSKPFLTEAFMKTVQDTARFHAATVGATLKIVLPKKVLDTMHVSSSQISNSISSKIKSSSSVLEKISFCHKSFLERIEVYKKAIEENPNTVIVTPTKERQNIFKKIFSTPVLLPSSLVEIPTNTSLIILEDEGSTAYKSISRPFIDFRYTLKKYAENIGASIMIGRESISTETEKILDHHKKEDDRPFTALGRYLERDLRLLKDSSAKSTSSLSLSPQRHLFVLGTRTGHSGTVLCQDCGSSARCTRCDSPLTLHLKSGKEAFNNLLCHHCGLKLSALTCVTCGGWRLKAFGLGIERIEEDIKAYCKKHSITAYVQRIDSTLKLTPKKIRNFIATHYEKEISILIATEIALPYLIEATMEGNKNDSSYIASLDSLLALPDFSINEKLWRLICQIDDFTKNKVVIQTRNTKHPLLQAWQDHTEESFWKEDLEERKTFNYPPHGVFVKITVKGKKEKIGFEMKNIEEKIKEWKPMIFPAFIKSIKNQHILHALLALPKDQWPNEELLAILTSLPQSVTVEVNPRSLL